jgi:hypothetical protein
MKTSQNEEEKEVVGGGVSEGDRNLTLSREQR